MFRNWDSPQSVFQILKGLSRGRPCDITDITDYAMLERCGVDWVFVDLEIIGKQERQAGRNTVVSGHSLGDVRAVRQVLSQSKLLVRVNPWGGLVGR